MLNELILELKQKNVHLYLQDGKLRCRGLPSVLSHNLKTALQEHKTELTEYLIKAQTLFYFLLHSIGYGS